ncbi:hypothetical protein CVIRNUC_007931 [Coccomyxa viridis]|uniref:Uncharacterized protein n=1 Tax=Coccomyxa viridis TaxID=1274662 RepID=A0AAV1IC85_9CHLO|nr:hypothetical protein CVIRNUC_007931 [Coccomyxa viridis]
MRLFHTRVQSFASRAHGATPFNVDQVRCPSEVGIGMAAHTPYTPCRAAAPAEDHARMHMPPHSCFTAATPGGPPRWRGAPTWQERATSAADWSAVRRRLASLWR